MEVRVMRTSLLGRLAAVLAVVLVSVVTGCGGGGEETEEPDVVKMDVPAEIADGVAELEAGGGCPGGLETCVWCAADEDCAGAFTDLAVCERSYCNKDAGICERGWLGAGTPCADDNKCNGEETCQVQDGGMACLAEVPTDCDDRNACNGLETCDSKTGCQPGEPLVCDDEDQCNGLETCDQDQGCVPGEPLVCDDEDQCNGLETCDPAAGCQAGESLACDDGDKCSGDEACDPIDGCLLGKPLKCDDGDVCNGLETCGAETGCVPGEPLVCDDSNDCTDEICTPEKGCVYYPNSNPGCCQADADCADWNPCTVDTCEPETKACQHDPATGPCEDGNPCTENDTCLEGGCQAGDSLPGCSLLCELAGDKGDVVDCPLRLARRNEAELPPTLLKATAKYPVESLLLVTLVEPVCHELGCTELYVPEGTVSIVETGHTIYLDPQAPDDWAGTVGLSIEHVTDVSVPLSDAWYEGDLLQGDSSLLALRFELKADVPAGDPIPIMAYDVEALDEDGASLAIAIADSTVVTRHEACGATQSHCFDARQCTQDECAEDTGKCSYAFQEGSCDDGNACTLGDFCDPQGDCVPKTPAAAGLDCFGDDLCTEIGTCNGAGKCEYDPAAAIKCPADPSDCASYACNPKTGKCGLSALAAGKACDDGAPCTQPDECDGLGTCVGKVKACDDGLECTGDSCNPQTGVCANTPYVTLCDDKNECTGDVCDPKNGCTHVPLNSGKCDDEDKCTADDKCAAGTCKGTYDVLKCGCTANADCAPLSQGDLCAGQYICEAGKCTLDPASVITCPAYAGDCKLWSCDPKTGKCLVANAPEGEPCTSNACVVDGTCDALGDCVGEVVPCDDGDECTKDSCDEDKGCQHQQNPDCASKFCVCQISGSAGSQVVCPFKLIRETVAVPAAAGADYKLTWDPAAVTLKSFEDEVCLGAICVPKAIPTCSAGGTNCVWGSLYPSGHNIVAVPKQLVEWTDHGTLLFFHPGDPFKAISEAYIDSEGNIVGDPTYLKAKLTLATDVPLEDPACLFVNDAHFSLPTGESLTMKLVDTVQGRAIVLSKK
jgi:hypothetical protein